MGGSYLVGPDGGWEDQTFSARETRGVHNPHPRTPLWSDSSCLPPRPALPHPTPHLQPLHSSPPPCFPLSTPSSLPSPPFGLVSTTPPPTGDIFIGNYLGDRREGMGTLYMMARQKKYVAEYVADQPKCGTVLEIEDTDLQPLQVGRGGGVGGGIGGKRGRGGVRGGGPGPQGERLRAATCSRCAGAGNGRGEGERKSGVGGK